MPQQGLDSILSRQLSKYQYPDRSKRDVMNAIKLYKGLTPKLENFVFNDGSRKELVCLDGTIPVPYKGNVYNIPVCVWLLDTHPYNSPMCYVRPTPDMQIKVSRHVDQSGRIYLPYLHEWNPNSSDLLGLIQVMIITFGEMPPVYSRPRTQESQPSFSNSCYPPNYSSGGYMPMPRVGGGNQTPYPPYPPAQPSNPYNPVTSSYSSYPGYPQASSYPYPYQAGGAPYPPSTGSVSTQPTPPYPPPYPLPTTTTATTTTTQQQQQQSSVPTTTGTITEAHIQASLLSAVEDKLKKRLKEVCAQNQAEMEVLRKTHDDLSKGKTKLDDLISRLEQELVDVQNNTRILKEKNEEMKEILTKMENQGKVEVDDAVMTTAPLYKQLLNAFAEENAIADAIYYLAEALRKGVIDLDLFLKLVRDLSRKQFMLRALMQKCRQKARLPF